VAVPGKAAVVGKRVVCGCGYDGGTVEETAGAPKEWNKKGKVVQGLLVVECAMAAVTYASWSFQWTVASIIGVGFELSRPKVHLFLLLHCS